MIRWGILGAGKIAHRSSASVDSRGKTIKSLKESMRFDFLLFFCLEKI
jgi:hypothetical protein